MLEPLLVQCQLHSWCLEWRQGCRPLHALQKGPPCNSHHPPLATWFPGIWAFTEVVPQHTHPRKARMAAQSLQSRREKTENERHSEEGRSHAQTAVLRLFFFFCAEPFNPFSFGPLCKCPNLTFIGKSMHSGGPLSNLPENTTEGGGQLWPGLHYKDPQTFPEDGI